MSSLPEFSLSPVDMAMRLKHTRGVGAVASNATKHALALNSSESQTAKGPFEGKVIELDGRQWQYRKTPTGRMVWDAARKQQVPEYYSLKTWFSHHTTNLGPGPGWDARLALSKLTPEEMLERHGHIFTEGEILAPSGRYNSETDQVEGGMPDDIPYYELEPMDVVASGKATPLK